MGIKINDRNQVEFIYRTAEYLIATVYAVGFIFLAIISLPAYLFRLIVKVFAKWFRTDLAGMLDPISTCLANDYFHKTTPRSNLVVWSVFQGYLTTEQIKLRLMDKWINNRDVNTGELIYPQFQQYPVSWWGFTFWKNDENFSIEDHIKTVRCTLTEEELDLKVEQVLNTPLPRNQSPWKIHFVEDYQHPEKSTEKHCVIILQHHHCLADGMAIQMALLTAFMDNFSLEKYQLPNIQKPKEKTTLYQIVAYPLVLFRYFVKVFVYAQQDCYFRIPDHKKKWHQVYAKSKPVSIQSIKNIKNRLGVSFTSVILSAISSATASFLENKGERKTKMPFLSVLPLPGADRLNNRLTNLVTAALFELPLSSNISPLERVQLCHDLLQNVRHSAPLLLYYICLFRGYHFNWANSLFENPAIPLGVTNVAVTPVNFMFGKARCVQILGVAGCLQGVAGGGFIVNSHLNAIQIQIAAEQAVMSREEARSLVEQVAQEIRKLETLKLE